MTRLTVQTRCQAGLAVAMPQETRHDAANSRLKRAIIAGGRLPSAATRVFSANARICGVLLAVEIGVASAAFIPFFRDYDQVQTLL